MIFAKGGITSIDFSKLEIPLQQKSVMKNQGSSTNSEQGLQAPFDSVSESVSISSTPTLDVLVEDQLLFKGDFQPVTQPSEGY